MAHNDKFGQFLSSYKKTTGSPVLVEAIQSLYRVYCEADSRQYDWEHEDAPELGVTRVSKDADNTMNLIDTNGNLLSDQWFDGIWKFEEGLAAVVLNGKYNFIDTKGRLISNQWFDNLKTSRFCKGLAGVELNEKWNFIDRNGNLLSPQWFDSITSFSSDPDDDFEFAKVKLNGKENVIGRDGRLVSDHWVNRIRFINADGTFSSDEDKADNE